ncbi:MAG: RNA polymerase subunit sigma, partial [Planctomycetaceae bacterium]|nr:RNA polymerase subunit sigma [Planctomycetaceae bacterium]
MSGPIVRTGTTPAFGDNWDRIFGGGTKTRSKATAKSKSGVAKTTAKVEKAAGKAAGTAKSVVAKT